MELQRPEHQAERAKLYAKQGIGLRLDNPTPSVRSFSLQKIALISWSQRTYRPTSFLFRLDPTLIRHAHLLSSSRIAEMICCALFPVQLLVPMALACIVDSPQPERDPCADLTWPLSSLPVWWLQPVRRFQPTGASTHDAPRTPRISHVQAWALLVSAVIGRANRQPCLPRHDPLAQCVSPASLFSSDQCDD